MTSNLGLQQLFSLSVNLLIKVLCKHLVCKMLQNQKRNFFTNQFSQANCKCHSNTLDFLVDFGKSQRKTVGMGIVWIGVNKIVTYSSNNLNFA